MLVSRSVRLSSWPGFRAVLYRGAACAPGPVPTKRDSTVGYGRRAPTDGPVRHKTRCVAAADECQVRAGQTSRT